LVFDGAEGIVIRRVLIGLLIFVAASILGGALWLAAVMVHGGTDTAELLEDFRWQWRGLILGSGLLCVGAVILQLTRPPAERWNWTFTASLGAGTCLYALGVRPLLPQEWISALPVPFSALVPLAVSIGVAYAVLWPLLRRMPAEPGATADRPRDDGSPS
jgi:hypothetical protein